MKTHLAQPVSALRSRTVIQSPEHRERLLTHAQRGDWGWLSECRMDRGNETETPSACGNNGFHLIICHMCTCILKITYSITFVVSLDNQFPCRFVPVTHTSNS